MLFFAFIFNQFIIFKDDCYNRAGGQAQPATGKHRCQLVGGNVSGSLLPRGNSRQILQKTKSMANTVDWEKVSSKHFFLIWKDWN